MLCVRVTLVHDTHHSWGIPKIHVFMQRKTIILQMGWSKETGYFVQLQASQSPSFKRKVSWNPLKTRKHFLPYLGMHQVQFQNLLNSLKGGVFLHIVGGFPPKISIFKSTWQPLSLSKKSIPPPSPTLLLINPEGNGLKHLHLWETSLWGTEPKTNYIWNTMQNPPFRKSLPPMMSRHPFIAR